MQKKTVSKLFRNGSKMVDFKIRKTFKKKMRETMFFMRGLSYKLADGISFTTLNHIRESITLPFRCIHRFNQDCTIFFEVQ